MKECERCKDRFLLQTKEDCRFYKRRCRDQTAHVHPLHRNMATGTAWNTGNTSFWVCSQVWSFTRYCLLRRWAYCCFPTTSPTAWSTSPRWWTTSGTTPETDPQTWVDPVTLLLLLLLLLIASCPPFITTLKISDLPPPRLLPIDTSLCPSWYTENTCFLLAGRCHLSIYIKTVNDRSSHITDTV